MKSPSTKAPHFDFSALAHAAAARYVGHGLAARWAHGMALGKLKGDPLFSALIAQNLLAERSRILDLGCGKALVASLLTSAVDTTAHSAQPPSYVGIEQSKPDLKHAQRALAQSSLHMTLTHGDLCDPACLASFPPSDLVLLFDVLHYLPPPAQIAALQQSYVCLAPGGRLLLRVGNKQQTWRFAWSRWVDQCVVFCRSGQWPTLHGRSLDAWLQALCDIGFEARAIAMSEGTAFANTLLIADKP